MKKISLCYREGASDKVYDASLEPKAVTMQLIGGARGVPPNATRICFAHSPNPEGISGNSPTLQRWEIPNNRPSPGGTTDVGPRFSRPFGTTSFWSPPPNVETLGFSRMSLRDTDLRGILPQALI